RPRGIARTLRYRGGDFRQTVYESLIELTTWISVKPIRPQVPFSTPMPDHLAPPNGRFGAIARCWLTQAEPHSSCDATSAPRAESLDHTEPLGPKWVAFARRIASSTSL